MRRHIEANALRVVRYHGQSKPKSLDELCNYDVILTTYGTVTAERRKGRKTLNSVKFFRIVLDEGTYLPLNLSSALLTPCSSCNPVAENAAIRGDSGSRQLSPMVSFGNPDPKQSPRSCLVVEIFESTFAGAEVHFQYEYN